MRIRIIQGANMNLLGKRDPELYGRMTPAELDERVRAHAARRGVEVDIHYTNSEAECIELIQQAYLEGWDGLVMNPGGFTRHSPVIGETLKATGVPYVEVHMKNLEAHGGQSVLAKHAIGVVMGFKGKGYLYALDALSDWLEETPARGRP
ncbi:MAG: type II 3-dehydroquinate dehydratase [Nitrospinota bacterium]